MPSAVEPFRDGRCQEALDGRETGMIGTLFLAYVGLGVLFGLWFLFGGHRRVDATSADAAWYTRLLWLPGAVLLWPLLIRKALPAAKDAGPQEDAA